MIHIISHEDDYIFSTVIFANLGHKIRWGIFSWIQIYQTSTINVEFCCHAFFEFPPNRCFFGGLNATGIEGIFVSEVRHVFQQLRRRWWLFWAAREGCRKACLLCFFLIPTKYLVYKKYRILLMEEIPHQLIWRNYHYLQGFIHLRWCRISSINSITGYHRWNQHNEWTKFDWMMLLFSRKRPWPWCEFIICDERPPCNGIYLCWAPR